MSVGQELTRLLVTFCNVKTITLGRKVEEEFTFSQNIHPKFSTSAMLECRLLLGVMLSAPMPESLGNAFHNEESDLSNAEIPKRFTLKHVSFNDGKENVFFLLEKECETELEMSLEEFCRQLSCAQAVVKELELEKQIIFGLLTVQEHADQKPETCRVGPF